MSAATSIQWTDRTWNPVRGCSVISPGCVNCYAMKMAHRFSGDGKPYAGLTKQTKAGPQWTGKIRLVPEALSEPSSWRKPARVFVNSMSDLFHDGVPDSFIASVFAEMALTPRHTFQVLTKRPERMRDVVSALAPLHTALDGSGWPLPNIWLGVSCEDQKRADERIPHLLKTPAAVRFISAEPLLGPIDLSCGYWLEREPGVSFSTLDWVIVGGESGPGARTCEVDWIRDIVAQCESAGVACFVKQLGSAPLDRRVRVTNIVDALAATGGFLQDSKGGDINEWPESLRVRQFPGGAA